MSSNLIFNPHVAVYDTGKGEYPMMPPFHPPLHYPEYPFNSGEIDSDNTVYHSIRQLFVLLNLDLLHYDTNKWNPLGEIIKPGDNVVLKPNLVISDHPDGLPGIQASVVHGSIIRAFIDYVFIANKGYGRITIADSPIKEVDFQKILNLVGIGPTVEYLNQEYNLEIELIDFRDLQVTRNENRVMVDSKRLVGDPTGYRIIDLGKKSMLDEISNFSDRYRSTAAFFENVVNQAHNTQQNLYSLPNRILNSDVVISLAKLKTHRKAGVTLSLKNMVGITNEKRWLPHHRVGSPSHGGDLFSDRTRIDVKLKERIKDILISNSWGGFATKYFGIPLLKIYKHFTLPFLDRVLTSEPYRKVEDGDWYGNNTVWRMVLDLNTLLFYTDEFGVLRNEPQRRYFSIVDGIIGGMEEGPLRPRPSGSGIIIAGFNPVAVDLVSSKLMGFDYNRIPMIKRALERAWLPLSQFEMDEICISSNFKRWENILMTDDIGLGYTPSKGWQGYLEINSPEK